MQCVFAAMEYLVKERMAGKYSTPSQVRGFALAECLNPVVLELLLFTGPIPPEPWDEETREAIEMVGAALQAKPRSRPLAAANEESLTTKDD
ncbi:MAG: hypothetical protein KOO63_00280 [Bacteroidales bacterium]|nr:hypothetical protein [Candidatus Latescibacterota bacterium]